VVIKLSKMSELAISSLICVRSVSMLQFKLALDLPYGKGREDQGRREGFYILYLINEVAVS
jgi:hypothetical protein